MTKILTTQNAQITTAIVAVETLTISGKQVTQSVFRQLLEERLISSSGELRGTPWGIVNYCPDPSCKTSPREAAIYGPNPAHIHVVWQKDNELRRTTVWTKRPRATLDGWGSSRSGEVATPELMEQLEELPHLFIAV
ncbi:hypothetical protein [Streptosporangium sp. NBC_01756]|uniref:hypothetical protein n=1 Tax=Streptosporangium sp. NBC_01756 TaxID=2975950 RepID=UPI002DDBE292|nr:hypothetical protein [Streptosporangium sp. NBC_01756]WSC90067.1 hypothetical protein OIE48_18365 [Streptosporangium sp. NBC_01756]